MTKQNTIYLVIDTNIVYSAYRKPEPQLIGIYQAFLNEVLKHSHIRLLMAPPDRWPADLEAARLRPVQGTWEEWCEKIKELKQPARPKPGSLQHPLIIWWLAMRQRTVWPEQPKIELAVIQQLSRVKDDLVAYLKQHPDRAWAEKYLFEIGEDFHLIKGAILSASLERQAEDLTLDGSLGGGRVVSDDYKMRNALAGACIIVPLLPGIAWLTVTPIKEDRSQDGWRMGGQEFREWLRTGLTIEPQLTLGYTPPAV